MFVSAGIGYSNRRLRRLMAPYRTGSLPSLCLPLSLASGGPRKTSTLTTPLHRRTDASYSPSWSACWAHGRILAFTHVLGVMQVCQSTCKRGALCGLCLQTRLPRRQCASICLNMCLASLYARAFGRTHNALTPSGLARLEEHWTDSATGRREFTVQHETGVDLYRPRHKRPQPRDRSMPSTGHSGSQPQPQE
jgi:hypothetical protein